MHALASCFLGRNTHSAFKYRGIVTGWSVWPHHTMSCQFIMGIESIACWKYHNYVIYFNNLSHIPLCIEVRVVSFYNLQLGSVTVVWYLVGVVAQHSAFVHIDWRLECTLISYYSVINQYNWRFKYPRDVCEMWPEQNVWALNIYINRSVRAHPF